MSKTQFIQGKVLSFGTGKGQIYYIMQRNDGSEFVALFPIDEDPATRAKITVAIDNILST